MEIMRKIVINLKPDGTIKWTEVAVFPGEKPVDIKNNVKENQQ